jgi:hypothetical protein
MDTSRSPFIAPVYGRLKSVFEAAVSEPVPVDLNRLLEALDEAYSRGELFSSPQPFQTAARRA